MTTGVGTTALTGTGPELAQLVAATACVIFDFDGVIADSEPISLRTLQDTFAQYGIDMPLAQVRAQFLGKSLATIEAYVTEHGPGRTAGDFATAWKKTLFEQFRADLSVIPGLTGVLDALDETGRPYCVASSSTLDRLDVAVDAIHLQDRLPHLFSAEQVDHGKPAPDLFLFAASQMQQDPGTCLVIEDSPFGVRAARAAGMRSIGFIGGSHLRGIEQDHTALLLDAGAAWVIPDYEGLILALKHA